MDTNTTIITQEIHIMKRVFGESVIDAILKTVDDAIKSAPVKLTPEFEMTPALYMFADLIYDEDGVKRLINFSNYGPLYIAHIYNKNGYSETKDRSSVFCVYSIYDILEVFNLTTKKKMLRAPYITISEIPFASSYSVLISDSPKNYGEDCKCDFEKALNEIGKYKFYFWKGLPQVVHDYEPDTSRLLKVVDVICNPHVISASSPYEPVDVTRLSNSICGTVRFSKTAYLYEDGEDADVVKIDEYGRNVSYCYPLTDNDAHTADSLISRRELDIDDNNERMYHDKKTKLLGWITSMPNKEDEIVSNPIELDDVLLTGGDITLYPVFKVIKEPEVWETKFIDSVHAGTGAYGNSADAEPKDQTANQSKVYIQTKIENGKKYIDLYAGYDELDSWLSTNPNQQDGVHEWFALDFVFTPESLSRGLIWGVDTELTPEVLDADEGENTLTLWLKLDDVKNNPRQIILTDKNDPDNNEVVTIRFFEEYVNGQ